MIKRPRGSKEWKTDQAHPGERERMEQELATAVQRSVNSLRNKLQELVRREQTREVAE